MVFRFAQISTVQYTTLLLMTFITFMLSLYALNWCLLTLISVRRRRSVKPPAVAEWPKVSIHLPFYNEAKVASRLLDACLGLDYPKDKLEIIVVDDSTDETTQITRDYAARNPGRIRVIHRDNRDGFKAGALQVALQNTAGDYVAIFDADYVPHSSLLKEMLPYFYTDPKVAFVQARCGYLNPSTSWITKAVALGIDGYCLIDQRARHKANLLAHFCGTNGIFRLESLKSVGGWASDTLVEDLDLSVRLQLKGWRYVYLPNIVCAGEIPHTLKTFRRQQFRWAKGFTECFLKHWRSILTHRGLSIFQKIEAVFLLATYFMCPISVAGLALTLTYYAIFPLSFLRTEYWQTIFAPVLSGLSTVIYMAPIIVYGTTVSELRSQGRKRFIRLFHIPYLLGLGFAVIFTNGVAVLEGFLGVKSPFHRTPKYGLID